jgi:hypothetical protein
MTLLGYVYGWQREGNYKKTLFETSGLRPKKFREQPQQTKETLNITKNINTFELDIWMGEREGTDKTTIKGPKCVFVSQVWGLGYR